MEKDEISDFYARQYKQEKNFENGFPFQSFGQFYLFIKKAKPFPRNVNSGGESLTPSIRLLLLISLCYGIKVSQLIQMIWSDVLEIDGENRVKTLSTVKFNKVEFPMTLKLDREFKFHYRMMSRPRSNDYVFQTNNGEPINPRNLSRDIRTALKIMNFEFADQFETKSTLIMFGRRVLTVHGYNPRTIRELKKHLKFNSEFALLEFLHIHPKEVNQREIHEGLLAGIGH